LDKGIVLDLLVQFANGARVNIEMQAEKRRSFRNRALYYWARTFGGQATRGTDYDELCPSSASSFSTT
jgi:predicted transposase/invertase (TIGR01784 family)